MLSIGEIKKGCEFAEGISFLDKYDDFNNWSELIFDAPDTYWEMFQLNYGDTTDDLGEMYNAIYHPLFLQRVIEGINKGEDFEIHTNRSNILVYNHYDGFPRGFEYTGDETKEEAIKYILEQLD